MCRKRSNCFCIFSCSVYGSVLYVAFLFWILCWFLIAASRKKRTKKNKLETKQSGRYPKRNIPRLDYSELEVPSEDEFLCKWHLLNLLSYKFYIFVYIQKCRIYTTKDSISATYTRIHPHSEPLVQSNLVEECFFSDSVLTALSQVYSSLFSFFYWLQLKTSIIFKTRMLHTKQNHKHYSWKYKNNLTFSYTCSQKI